MGLRIALLALAMLAPGTAGAAPDAALAKEVLMRSVAIPSYAGSGQTPRLAAYYASVLGQAGYLPSQIEIVPVERTAALAVTLPGSDPALRPIVLIGHMDVVAANRADWARDPFVPVEEGGYIHGRGAEDNKYDVAMMVTLMAGLKREGWMPRRSVVLLVSGDEETRMATGQMLAQRYRDAELVLNGDAGGGLLDQDGRPVFYQVQAGEKSYADFELSFTDPGGHSSVPTPGNPIYRLARALDKVGAYRFPVMANELTRAWLRLSAERIGGEVGRAMSLFAATGDEESAELLSRHPEFVGQVRTTCVATMAQAGHASNALPQRATATINCRIFPGVTVDSVKAVLTKVVADPSATIRTLDEPTASAASPLRDDVMKAVTAAVSARYPGISVVPGMSAGATDSMYFRALGVPSYGVSSLFQRAEDGFAHGLNERVPVAGIPGALKQWESVVKALAK